MAVKGVQRHKTVMEILNERKPVEDDKLAQAEAEANTSNKPIQTVLLEKEFMTKEALLALLSEEWKVEVADIHNADIDAEVVKIVPESVARRGLSLPFEKGENSLSVAMANPLDMFIIEDLQTRTGLEIKPFLALPVDIISNIDAAHGKGGGALMSKIKQDEESAGENWADKWEPDKDGKGLEVVKEVQKTSDITKVDASAPEVEKMVNAIILSAIKMKASDIHIEPMEDPTGKNSKVVLRYRVDGMLRPGPFSVPWPYRFALSAKIKIMTNSMNITERRIPQSGRIQVLNQGNPLEFRVEMVPTVYGESVVMRILDRRSVQVDINKMGFLPDTLERFLGLLKGIGGKKNFGLIVVCGPTGSGKSTTLYAALNYVNRPDIKIITAENPVEYNLDGIVQVPVNPDLKLGEDKKFDFATALRSFLRLDPDVIMVGEIRDQETCHIAMEAAMTGHLVFSTIHTNDAPSSISRMVDMHVPEFMVVATVKAVLAQRLSRRLCPDCKEARDPKEDEIKIFEENKVELPPGQKLYQPKGCPTCNNTGFKGRMGMHELMVLTEELRGFMLQTVAADPLRAAAQKLGMRLLVQDGLEKVKTGLTTVREVLGGTE
ncbi:MAG: Flp pilus assembly complex ATPase component TadA [Elusimicrobia bacterium]|nr:Flp pilus assembly complex ATPase component TadA [Elusimicrobiota bacterium]